MMEFQKWPKMPRLNKVGVFVTEKIDGTNAQIAINNEFDDIVPCSVRAASRNRWITRDSDNYGFAQAVYERSASLRILLPPGRHYGEWAGLGIQKNPLGLKERRFFAFNRGLFTPEFVAEIQKQVPWFDVVPLWLQTTLDDPTLGAQLAGFTEAVALGRRPEGARELGGVPEGFIVYMANQYIKWTPQGEKWKGISPAEKEIPPVSTDTATQTFPQPSKADTAVGAFGARLIIGDTVVYPTRRGSAQWLVRGKIVDFVHNQSGGVTQLKISVNAESCPWSGQWNHCTRQTTVRRLSQVVRIPE